MYTRNTDSDLAKQLPIAPFAIICRLEMMFLGSWLQGQGPSPFLGSHGHRRTPHTSTFSQTASFRHSAVTTAASCDSSRCRLWYILAQMLPAQITGSRPRGHLPATTQVPHAWWRPAACCTLLAGPASIRTPCTMLRASFKGIFPSTRLPGCPPRVGSRTHCLGAASGTPGAGGPDRRRHDLRTPLRHSHLSPALPAGWLLAAQPAAG